MIKDFCKTAIIVGEREVSYRAMLKRIELYAAETEMAEGDRTVIFSENREGWIYAFFSVWNNRGIAVPVDATSTVDDVAYILNDCRPRHLWCSASHADTARSAAEKSGVNVVLHIIDELEKADVDEGELKPYSWADEDATSLIIYTSGTTGSPKGVMLSFANLYANIRGVCDGIHIFNENRRTLILLPVHHILPLMGTVIAPIIMGGGVAICPTMSGPDIMATLCRGKVAIFVGVPRLWQTLYNGIMKKIDANAVTRLLFGMCKKVRSRRLSRIVFSSVRKKMGGHIDFCVSGGAALDRDVSEGLQALGLDVLEGYGMTETAPIISFTRPNDIIPGCCGLPLPGVECKIVNGEICAKGPNLMKGYYNRPEETAAVIDSDGFLHTGDLARFDEKGRVYITGRTKEIIVLSNGKNVQPSEIEYKIEKYDTQVKEAAVVQDGDMLRVIIVPQEQWVAGRGDEELSVALKREVLEPYNLTVMNYKKLMSVYVYHGELPRTRLEKLQRYKLKDIIAKGSLPETKDEAPAAGDEHLSQEFMVLKAYIEREKRMPVSPLSHIETDLAFDSLDRVGLQGFIEQTFGMHLNADSMAAFKNIGEIAEHIAAEKTKIEVEDIDWHKILMNRTAVDAKLQTSSLTSLWSRLLRCFFKWHNSLKVVGVENIPAEGPFIIAPNHQSVLDGPLTMAGLGWKQTSDCYFYATEDHVQGAVVRFLAKHHNIVVMERRNLKSSIVRLADVLRHGKNVVIFPEGSRTHDGNMSGFKRTFAILSQELDVPIVPVRITGAFEALPRGRRIPNRTAITVEYLKPVLPDKLLSYEDLAEKVRDAIKG